MATTPHVSPERAAMLVDLFAAIDGQDVDALLSTMGPEATQTFGNNPPLEGHEAIREGNLHFFATIGGMSHEIVDAWEAAGTIAIRLSVTYTRLDGGVVTIPVVTLLHVDDSGLIDTYQVFADMAPIFAPAAP